MTGGALTDRELCLDCHLQGLELLLDHHKQELQFDRFTAPKVTAAPVTGIDELLVSLQQMYIATDSVVNMQSEMNLSTAMSSLSYVTQDELLAGKCIEVTTSMLLHCGFRDAGQAVWRRMSKMPQERENSASLGIFAMQVCVYPVVIRVHLRAHSDHSFVGVHV